MTPSASDEVGEHQLDQLGVVALQHGLLAEPADRGADDDAAPGAAPAYQPHFVEENVTALTDPPSTGGTRNPDPAAAAGTPCPGRRA